MMVVTPENKRQRQCAVEYWQDVQRAAIFIELRMNRCLQSSLLCQVVARDKDVKVAPVPAANWRFLSFMACFLRGCAKPDAFPD